MPLVLVQRVVDRILAAPAHHIVVLSPLAQVDLGAVVAVVLARGAGEGPPRYEPLAQGERWACNLGPNGTIPFGLSALIE